MDFFCWVCGEFGCGGEVGVVEIVDVGCVDVFE